MLLSLGCAPSGFDFPFVGAFDFGVAVVLDVAVVLCSFDQGSLLESRGNIDLSLKSYSRWRTGTTSAQGGLSTSAKPRYQCLIR